MGDLIAGMAGLIDGIVYDFVLSDFSARTKLGAKPYHLAKGTFNADISGLAGEKAKFDLGFGHDGLTIDRQVTGLDALVIRLVPGSSKIDLALSDVPAKDLWRVLGENVPSIATSGGGRMEMALFAMFGAMQQIVKQATMKLTLEPSNLMAELVQFDASGAFDVRPQTVTGLVGKLDIAIHGIDDAMLAANEAAATSPDATNILMGLSMLQAQAKREQDAEGKPVDRLVIEMTEAGAMLINGAPFAGP
jgi:hypothetical protein